MSDNTSKDRLTERLDEEQGRLIFSFWKNPSLLDEYEINRKELTEEGLFYYGLAIKMHKFKHTVFDEVSIYSILDGNKALMSRWEKYGGFDGLREGLEFIDEANIETYYRNFNKYCLLRSLRKKGFDIYSQWDRFELMNEEEVYAYFEYQLNSITINTSTDGLEFEDLSITDEELKEVMSGANMGLQFGRKSPILNHAVMGLPKGELNAICGYINEGKTSLAFENFVMPILDNGHKVLIISTEQRSVVFKFLLLVHVLTDELDYWKLTRKKLKAGVYTDEDMMMINKAREIIRERYTDKLIFLKLYDYNTDIVTKAIKKYANVGLEMVLYDVLKFDSNSEGQIWERLINDSKNLFQCCSKYNVCGLVTLQLAMATRNKIRRVGMECVANSKAIFEVMSECMFIRSLWLDEIDEESKFYCNPYKFKKDENTGKYTSIKEEIKLNRDKHYKVISLGKSRNDSTDLFLLYEVDFNWNKWREIGYCTISDQNRY